MKEREVPVPAGASDQIQAEIAAAAQPDPAVMRAFKSTTEAQWRALIAQHGKDQEVSLDELGKRLKVTITRDEIAGVRVHRVMPTELPTENSNRLFTYHALQGLGAGDLANGHSASLKMP